MNRVPNSFSFQTAPVHAPEVRVLRIDLAVVFIGEAAGALIGVRQHDDAVQGFQAPVVRYEFRRQPIQ